MAFICIVTIWCWFYLWSAFLHTQCHKKTDSMEWFTPMATKRWWKMIPSNWKLILKPKHFENEMEIVTVKPFSKRTVINISNLKTVRSWTFVTCHRIYYFVWGMISEFEQRIIFSYIFAKPFIICQSLQEILTIHAFLNGMKRTNFAITILLYSILFCWFQMFRHTKRFLI